MQTDALIMNMFEGVGLYPPAQSLQYYYTNTLKPKIETAFKQFADELRNAFVFPVGPIGAMLDGQNLNQTLTSLGKQNAASLQSYTASDQVCRFGTLGRSLSKSQDQSTVVQLGLADAMLKRQMLQANMNSGSEVLANQKTGRASDKIGRLDQYKHKFCDPADSAGALAKGGCVATSDARYNKDINITKTLFNPLSLNMDFSSNPQPDSKALTSDEEDVLALANNLYANDLMVGMGPADIKNMVGNPNGGGAQKLQDFRSLSAKRSVAANSFAALASLKADGSGASTEYLKKMVESLGLDSGGQTAALGDRPSYYAQMEVLTKLLYQSPSFYANLMESPANLARQQTAMEGIALMQDRDIYDSLRRSELLISTLLEVNIAKEQDALKDKAVK